MDPLGIGIVDSLGAGSWASFPDLLGYHQQAIWLDRETAMDKNHLTELADELEQAHGPCPRGRADLEIWIMGEATAAGWAGEDPSAFRDALHASYPAWLQEIAWLDLEDVGREIIDFEPPKAIIHLQVPDDFDELGREDIQQQFEGDDKKGDCGGS